MTSGKLLIKYLMGAPFKPPTFKPAKDGDVGYDLYVCTFEDEIVVPAGSFVNVPTGIAIKLPEGTWASIRARSSTFAKKRLFVMDGTIDNGYTGPLFVFIFNPNKYDVSIKKSERLAQLTVHPMVNCDVQEVKELPDTERGTTGFGSTG